MENLKKKIVYIFHLILVLLADTSWLWLDYRIIFVFTILFLLQYFIIGNCILTKLQYTQSGMIDKDETFVWNVLNDIGITLSKKKVAFANRFIVPILILSLAIIMQLILNVNVFIKF